MVDQHTGGLCAKLCVGVCVITWYSAAGDFHVQLHRVHAQNGVAHMAEQVPSRDHSGEGWQFTQLLQLLLPPGGEGGNSTA